MDDAAGSHSILDTLRTVEFRLGLKGYNVDEVDEYLEKAAVEAEQIQERLRTANERLRHATERIAQLEVEVQHPTAERTLARQPPAPEALTVAPTQSEQPVSVTEDTLQRTLLLAQKFVDQTKRESEAEAAQVVSRAEERARALLAQAEERARRLASETEDRLRDEVARLEETRAHLRGDVEEMSRYLEEQRTRVRTSLVEALSWVDERMHAPTVSAGKGAGEGGAGGRDADRQSSGEAAGRAVPAELAGAGGPPGSSEQRVAGTGSLVAAGTRPQVVPSASVAPERQQPPSVPSRPPTAVPAPDRTQAPVGAGLGLMKGGLFEAGREETNALEGNKLAD